MTRKGEGSILGVLNFLIISTVRKLEIVPCKIHEHLFFAFFFFFSQNSASALSFTMKRALD